MKISIERNSFLNSLSHVQNIVEKRNTIPILSNILIDAHSNNLILSATDMDVSVTEAINCNVIEQGSVTTPAHTLYDIVRKIPEGNEIELISNDGNKLSFRSGKSKFSLSCLPKDDFPKIEELDLKNEFTINSKELIKIIDKTKFAISTEETRYYLNGIYLHVGAKDNKKILVSVATDGHRLAKVETDLPEGAENLSGVIIPKKTINEVRKLIDEQNNDIRVALNENKIVFYINNVILSSKLIDGSFPEYEKVIPKNNDKTLEINTNQIYEAIDRVSTVSDVKSNSIKLSIMDNIISISSNNSETGSGAEDINIDYVGEKIEIGFNAKYLLEILSQIDSEKLNFKLLDSSSPTIITDSEDNHSIYVLMPMRV
tara:strand:- start:4537 stop:5652 length:1116 start_codon:yes stop_codon:yes gene_type:complete